MFIGILILINFCIIGTFQAFAHQETLEVSYDGCVVADDENAVNDDGIDEMWYKLNIPLYDWHYDHNESTIAYHFEEIPENSIMLDNPCRCRPEAAP